jgi:hypothetical protein
MDDNEQTKQSRTADKTDPPAWRLGVGLKTLTVYYKLVEDFHKHSECSSELIRARILVKCFVLVFY